MSHRRESYLGTPEAKQYQHALEEQRQEIEQLRSLLTNSEMTVKELLANDERLRAALQTIDDGAQCDWCADIARKALEEKP